MKKKMVVGFLAFVLLISGGALTKAGTAFTSYNTTVGKFNGSGYTSYQTKAKSSADGYLNSATVGGNYQVDARMNSSSGTGPWVRIDDNRSYFLINSVKSGAAARVQFSNDLSTPVSVQVTGTWSSN
ncbi:hypothetical protein [Sporosarcina trichiuri]|uniref:hypothetical protein n=1 Tax=Sporosarcina trichiuri TaxID=3056445 RepID=UPI0025B363FA|nr:hypothetical protein [Sporosarcina sp. 0.2-SM1T-5]WJY26568.1 hypothetical protein QWT68_10800 [Sporosarcina sp. 0.2-SM1T-5]